MKKPTTTAKLWHNGEIPAKVFFEIMSTQKLSLLKKDEGSAKKGLLKKTWTAIYDEYFELKADQKLNLIITSQKNIIQMIRQVELVRQAVYVICTTQIEDDELKDIADKIIKLGFTFDINCPLDSCSSILVEQIPSYETRIELDKEMLDGLTEGEVSTFEDNCVSYEQWGFTIDENCSLRRYVAYEKAVIKKARKQKSNGKR